MQLFEEKINVDLPLSKLLNKHEVDVLTDFSKSDYDDTFKEYIEDRYYESFKTIYERDRDNIHEKDTCIFLRSIEFLATENIKKRISDDLKVELENAYDDLAYIWRALSYESVLVEKLETLNSPLRYLVCEIMDKLGDQEEIKVLKKKVLGVALDICDEVSTASPRWNTLKYAIYNLIINNLKKVKDFGNLEGRYKYHRSKIGRKRTSIEIRYWIGAILAFIVAFLAAATWFV